MNTVENTNKLIEALKNTDRNKIKTLFESIDNKSTSINDWQNYLGFPLEPHSCQICHRIRNKIYSAINHYFGVDHLDGNKFPALAEVYFNEALELINEAEPIKSKLNEVYPLISRMLYAN
jgi:hypothetical protein